MVDHISLGTCKFQEAIAFYTECFAPLGYKLEHRTDVEAAFGNGTWDFWLYPVSVPASIVGERSHVAVSAATRDQVIAFHRIAIQRGAVTVRDAGERPDIGPQYFGTVVRDLDGHTVEVVFWSR